MRSGLFPTLMPGRLLIPAPTCARQRGDLCARPGRARISAWSRSSRLNKMDRAHRRFADGAVAPVLLFLYQQLTTRRLQNFPAGVPPSIILAPESALTAI